MKKVILVLFGGRSGEHEVSIRSASSVIDNLEQSKYTILAAAIDKKGFLLKPAESAALLPLATQKKLFLESDFDLSPEPSWKDKVDIVFPVLHGTYGEDGTIQGLLELADVPYIGAGVLGAAASMDKDVMKRLLRERGIPTVDHMLVLRNYYLDSIAEIERKFPYPVFVKPANLGSSVGITRPECREELHRSLALAAKYDRKIIIEPSITGREIECAVLGNTEPKPSIPGEIILAEGFYDYETKYASGNATFVIPAQLDVVQQEEVQRLAVEAFTAVEGRGLARVDFFLQQEGGGILVNEVNTMPGFTSISMYPKMWMATGLSYSALLDQLVELGIESYTEKMMTKFTIT